MERSPTRFILDHLTFVRRSAVAMGVAGLIAGALRATGGKPLSSTRGGWTELTFESEERLGEIPSAEQHAAPHPDALD